MKCHSNLDVIVMVVAWGLELSNPIEEVGYVARSLFVEDMLGGLDSILEWSIPGIGSDLSECFEDEDEGMCYGYIPFLRWRAKVDKPSLYKVAKDSWENLQEELNQVVGKDAQSTNEWANFPCQRRSPQGRSAVLENQE